MLFLCSNFFVVAHAGILPLVSHSTPFHHSTQTVSRSLHHGCLLGMDQESHATAQTCLKGYSEGEVPVIPNLTPSPFLFHTPCSSQLPLDIKLFSMGFLAPEEIDSLQLVSSALHSLVQTHGRHLHRHGPLHIAYDYKTVYFKVWHLPVDRYPGRRILLSDEEAIAHWLNSNRVAYVEQLVLRDDLPPDGGGNLLTTRLCHERIPVQSVVLLVSRAPEPALRLANHLHVGCLEVMDGRGDFLGHPELYRTIPHLVYHSQRGRFDTGVANQLFDGFPGRVVYRLWLPSSAQETETVVVALREFACQVTRQYQSGAVGLGEVALPRDFLVIYEGGQYWYSHVWREALGEPDERGVSMDEWWREAGEGKTPLHDCYRLLRGSEWAVWSRDGIRSGRDVPTGPVPVSRPGIKF